MKFMPKDIIALVALVGLIYLLSIGYDGWVQASISLILAYYFVKRSNGIDAGK